MKALNVLRDTIRQQPVPSVEKRVQHLLALREGIQRHEQALLAALKTDLGKSVSEAWIEIGGVLSEIELMVKELPLWAQGEKVKTPLVLMPGQSSIRSAPFGLVLILSPWNYPLQLSLKPLVGALAAGNRVVLKPSEISASVSQVLAKIIEETLPATEVIVVQGGVSETQALLKEKFDFIFFTGSTAVGQVVMKAAAEHLTPVILELGGKSPCIVDETANIAQAARRIVWGKFSNAGQTCVAPDYVIVHATVKERLMQECQLALTQFYGSDAGQSPDFGRIVSSKHFDRLLGLMQGSQVKFGGTHKREERFIAPTLVDNADWSDALMREEIFGPILPFLTFTDLSEAVEKIRQRAKPLALYLFSQSRSTQELVLEQLDFGGACLNDTIVHLGNHHLPFGGVGGSGMGHYHGKFSFEAFSHKKAIFQQTTLVDIPVRYPPYAGKEKLIKFLLG